MARKRKRQEDTSGSGRRQRTSQQTFTVRSLALPQPPRAARQITEHTHCTQRHQSSLSSTSSSQADFVCVTVKTTMNSFMTSTARQLHLPWDAVLHDMNKAVLEAYLLANIHVLRLTRTNRPLEELGQTFFSKCLTAVMAGHPTLASSADLVESVEIYNAWRDARTGRSNNHFISTGWQQCAARQMATSAGNAVCGNFYRRFHKHLKRTYEIDGRRAYTMLNKIPPPNYNGNDTRILLWRARIPRNAGGRLDERTHMLIPLTVTFLSSVERLNAETEAAREADPDNNDGVENVKIFSVLPFKRGFRCSYFKMCTNGLWSLLKRAGAEVPPLARGPGQTGTVWRDVAGAFWRELFHIDKFETSTRRFAGEISTDGKNVSITLKKPKQDNAHLAPQLSDFDELWGLDPGRRDLFVATNTQREKLSCSGREFYEDARYTASNKTMKGWIESNSEVARSFAAMPTRKTASLESLKTYVEYVTPKLDMLLGFEQRKPFRKLRFRRYIFAKKKLRALCLQLIARSGARTLVGFGNWSNTDLGGLIKRHPKGPVKTFEAKLKCYCRVESIDEFRTSKLHADCHTELNKQFSLQRCRGGRTRTRKAYSVLHCPSNGCFGTMDTVNRDDNASRNILLLLQYKLQGLRPIVFCRGT